MRNVPCQVFAGCINGFVRSRASKNRKGSAMKRITHSLIQKLARKNNHPSVSIYMTLNGDYYDIRERGLLMLKQARDKLLDFVDYEEARQLLQPAYEAIHNRNNWAYEAHEAGAAMFIDKDGVQLVAFPDTEQPSVVVGHGFSLSHLFEQLVNHGRLYTLSITSRSATLYLHDVRGDHQVVTIRNKQALAGKNGKRNYYSRRMAGDGAAFPRRFISSVDKALRKKIEDRTAPLILVGLPKAQAAFRAITNYELVMPEGLKINPDSLQFAEIGERARPIAQQFYAYYEKAAQEEYKRRQASDAAHVVTGMRAVLSALRQRKVRTLFIDPKEAVWGEPLTMAVHATRRAGDENLTDMAVRQALSSDTEIFHPANAKSGVSAILKY